jgi:predicted TIM-barrel fold metal-dependent hydrolase
MTDIIDAHHHIWRRRDLPWLDGPMQPRIFGPYEAIRRDYLIDEYLADLAMQLAERPLRGRSRLRAASRP